MSDAPTQDPSVIAHLDELEALAGRIDSLVFDFDGVLVDSDDLHWQAYRLAFERYGIRFSREDYVERAKGTGRCEVIALFGASLDPMEREDVAQTKTNEARRLIEADGLKPIDGAIPFVRAASARGLACAVASTSEIAGLAIDAMGMTSLFDCVCAKRREDRAKPHPDVFLRAFEGLGRTADRCLVIEDTPIGVRAARAAEAPVVVRGRAADWPDAALGREVSAFFTSYASLHERLGWGSMAEDCL